MMCALHCAILMILGARPCGCRLARNTLQRRRQEVGRDALDEHRRGTVRSHELPAAIDEDRRIRLVCTQYAFDRVAHRLHLGRAEVGGLIGRRVSRGDQQRVAFAQRDVEVLGEAHHHRPARSRTAGLEEAEMARRRSRRSTRGRAGSSVGGCATRAAVARPVRRPELMLNRAPRSPYRRRRAETITSEGIDARRPAAHTARHDDHNPLPCARIHRMSGRVRSLRHADRRLDRKGMERADPLCRLAGARHRRPRDRPRGGHRGRRAREPQFR